MKRILILILIAIFSFNLVFALEEDSCEEIYYFIIENVDSYNHVNYNSDELDVLSNLTGVSTSTIEQTINNFSDCEVVTGLSLPIYKLEVGNLEFDNRTICDYKTNQTILFGTMDMDDFIPLKNGEGYVVGNISCDSIKFWKTFISYRVIDAENYAINGIKIWFPLFCIVLFTIVLFFKIMISNYRTTEEERKYWIMARKRKTFIK